MSIVTLFEATKDQPEEYGHIFEEHYDLTYRTAYGITRNAQDAEDVVQTIFLQLLRREVQPDLTKNPKGYFYRAAVNLSLRNIRSKQRYVLTNDSEHFEYQPELTEPNDSLDDHLWRAISELSDTAAQLLILRYVHDCSLTEIARIVGTSRGAVAVSLFRSRARLKKLIRVAQGENS